MVTKRIAYRLFFIISISLVIRYSSAQELNCNVQVVTQQIQGSNKQIFRTLQTAIHEFMNNRTWTNHTYNSNERIECNILINLTEQVSGDQFRGSLQVQSRRPVYNTTYNTTVINFLDDNLEFRYVEFQPLEFDPTQHLSNLTSILAYYAYVILGFDYETFSPEGGGEYLQIAETIVMNAQNAPERGWKAFDGSGNRNRYWLVQNILNDNYRPIRRFLYTYHRLGLDVFENNVNTARNQIEESLEYLRTVFRDKPDPYLFLLQLVLDAKTDEFINIFSEAFPDMKNRVVQLLKEIDPANIKKYDQIIQS